MDYLYIKSLHIIFVTTWFAGLFYIIRLFIYYKEADDKDEPAKTILKNQYTLMTFTKYLIVIFLFFIDIFLLIIYIFLFGNF